MCARRSTNKTECCDPEKGNVTISKISPAMVLLDCRSNGTIERGRVALPVGGVLKSMRWKTNDSILLL